MFLEYDMVTKKRFSEYFGFSETEVDDLFVKYQEETENPEITREALRNWYDGIAPPPERKYIIRVPLCVRLRIMNCQITGPVPDHMMRFFIMSATISKTSGTT